MFHEIRFPIAVSYGSSGGPQRRTEVVTLANGHEERTTPWAQSRHSYDAGFGLRSADDVAVLIDFFEARSGRLHGFRWKDWTDFRSARPGDDIEGGDQLLGTGDSARRDFQLLKHYVSGAQDYARIITKPVQGTVRITVGDVPMQEQIDYSVDYATGIVTFALPPEDDAEVRAGFEFDVPVRFDTDVLEISIATFEAGQIPSVPVVEVRV